MKLRQLAVELPAAQLLGDGEADVTAIAYDSRRLEAGALFVAVSGLRSDGHDYLAQAMTAGAGAVAVQADRREKWAPLLAERGVSALVVPDTRRALATLAAAFYGHPGRRLRVVGITGTDGKTTTVWLISAILETAGRRTGLLSTVACKVAERTTPNPYALTTPEAPQVQALLAEMVAAGVDYAILESTSHGLALHRLDGCEYDVAAFTNLAADHLDFHGSQEDYMRAKGHLFALLDESTPKPLTLSPSKGEQLQGSAEEGLPKTAVLNADDPAAAYFRSLTRARVLTYGVEAAADVRAEAIELSPWGSRFRLRLSSNVGATLRSPQSSLPVTLRLPGLFNVYNALAAAAVALSQGVAAEVVGEALAFFPGVPGRMERIEAGQPFTVVVDFAHAPNALRRAMEFLRSQTGGRLIVVFGCIGERDQHRRFPMGQAAGELADYAVVSNDNPFSEDAQAILAEIERGLLAAGRRRGADYAVIADRRQAIAHAFSRAAAGDAVLLAGKGHEQSITIGKTVIPWDERQVARELLRELR